MKYSLNLTYTFILEEEIMYSDKIMLQRYAFRVISRYYNVTLEKYNTGVDIYTTAIKNMRQGLVFCNINEIGVNHIENMKRSLDAFEKEYEERRDSVMEDLHKSIDRCSRGLEEFLKKFSPDELIDLPVEAEQYILKMGLEDYVDISVQDFITFNTNKKTPAQAWRAFKDFYSRSELPIHFSIYDVRQFDTALDSNDAAKYHIKKSISKGEVEKLGTGGGRGVKTLYRFKTN